MRKSTLLIILIVFISSCGGSDGISDGPYPNKQIPSSVKSTAHKALKSFPELEGIKINFVFKDGLGNHFMQAQPLPGTILKGPKERTYVIKMTPKMRISEDETIPISEMPEEVLLGWFAHELGHIKDYTDEGTLEMLWFGLRYYMSSDFKVTAERQADVYAIEAGFSEEIIATKNFILNNATLPDEYIAKIERLYLSPANVLEIVEDLADEEEEEMAEEFEEAREEG